MTQFGVPDDVDAFLRPILLKDCRVQLRARGLSPAGSREVLAQRLKEAMVATGDYTFKTAEGEVDVALTESAFRSQEPLMYQERNNYHRPEGQNVGNFLTDRNTSKVLAPPGGGSQVCFGEEEPQKPPQQKPARQAAPPPVSNTPPVAPPVAPASGERAGPGERAGTGDTQNNYARPGGMQNVGNFLTDRSSSRVLAPPGGQSNVFFG
ncbi:hypothetical protein BSKO_00396 [Bryopsis sp. KO-2023]|nr:hypothetical protein BSKO_00396 [Bryopsis sp. KO-2023]